MSKLIEWNRMADWLQMFIRCSSDAFRAPVTESDQNATFNRTDRNKQIETHRQLRLTNNHSTHESDQAQHLILPFFGETNFTAGTLSDEGHISGHLKSSIPKTFIEESCSRSSKFSSTFVAHERIQAESFSAYRKSAGRRGRRFIVNDQYAIQLI